VTGLSRPALAVVIVPGSTIDEAIKAERARRLAMALQGHAYHYWRERGDSKTPSQEWWCGHCAGFYGVPHDDHHGKGLCRSFGYCLGVRQCACIDCVVGEAWAAERGER